MSQPPHNPEQGWNPSGHQPQQGSNHPGQPQQGWNQPPQQQHAPKQGWDQSGQPHQQGWAQPGQAPQQGWNPSAPNQQAPNQHLPQQWPAQNPHNAAPQGPQGFINLTLQGNAAFRSFITPTVHIDGNLVAAQYGLNTIPVPPGRHHISVYGQWMRQYGQAEMDVDVAQGEYVPVFYAAPLHQFTTGSIGHEPQKTKGIAFMVTVVVAAVVLPILFLIVSALAS